MSRISIVTYDGSQYLNVDACKTKYYKFLNEIERKITEFKQNGQVQICEKCKEIKEFISKKNAELKDCYDSYVLPIKLNEENKIKVFNRKCPGKSQCSRHSTPPFKEGAKLGQNAKEVERDLNNNEQPQLQSKGHHDKASECHKSPCNTKILEPIDESNGARATESDRGAALSTLSDQSDHHLKNISCLNDSETNSTFYYISAPPLENNTDNALHSLNESEKYASVNKQTYHKNNYYIRCDSNATNNVYDDFIIFTLRNIPNPVHKSKIETKDTPSKEAGSIKEPSQRSLDTGSISHQRSQEQTSSEKDELSKEHSTESQDSPSQNLRDQASQIVKGESPTEGNSDNAIRQQHQAGLGSSMTLVNGYTHYSNQDSAETDFRSSDSKSLTMDTYSEQTQTPGENSESDIFNIIFGEIPLQKYIFPALAILGAIALFSLLLKYTYLGALFSKKKKKRRKEIEADWQNILYGAPYVGQRNNYISYGGMEYE
ncbi:PIR protein [Plasmodium vivax]|nr:PIR protein [Plasmodium vivax]